MNSQFFVSCLESRIEEETRWYSRFELGPFIPGQALTVANSLRRTLLAQEKGIFLIAVEIEGAVHEYSRLEGIKESILDILLNFRQIALILKDENELINNSQTLIGYFDIQGPGDVYAKDLKFPKKVECINPNQKIATLTRNGNFQGRFLITINSNLFFKTNSIGDPLKFSREGLNEEFITKISNTNWLYVNPILQPVQRVNYVVQQAGDILAKKEIVILELWTNGTIHPKKAIQNCCSELANLFSGLSVFYENTLKYSSSVNRFKQIKVVSEENLSVSNLVSSNLSTAAKEAKINEFSDVIPSEIQDKFSEKISTILDLDIANLNLSLKIYLALKTCNIENIGNLIQYRKVELKKLSNISDQSLIEIEKALSLFGLEFS